MNHLKAWRLIMKSFFLGGLQFVEDPVIFEHLAPAHTHEKHSWMVSNTADPLIHKCCGTLRGRSKNSDIGVGVRVDILLSD